MKNTHPKKNKNVMTGKAELTRRIGHLQQRVNILNPNHKNYKRQEGKAIPNEG